MLMDQHGATCQRPSNPLIVFDFYRSSDKDLANVSCRNHYDELEALGQEEDHPFYYTAFGGFYPIGTLAGLRANGGLSAKCVFLILAVQESI